MRAIFLATAALAALPLSSRAAEPLGELIVTATRLPLKPDQVTGARVIDQAEIETRGAAFATDLLATVPGVGVSRNGAFGGVSSIRIRGQGADKTLVLIDGVPVGDPADPSGAFDPSSLQLSDIARVEALSGPQGALWGSEAIGGVVAFQSREPQGWRAQAEAGSFATFRGSAAIGVSKSDYGLNASIAAFRTEGISKADGGSEDDGFRTLTIGLGGRRTGEALTLDGRVRYTDSRIDIDGYPAPSYLLADTPDRNTGRVWSGFARAAFDAADFRHQLSLSLYNLTRRNISDFPSRYTAERRVLRWTAERQGLVVGAERQDTKADLSGRPSLDLSNTAVFAAASHAVSPRINVAASLRYDDPDRFKARATGRLSAAWTLPAGLTLTASAGQGFKTPTISQTACDFCFPSGAALDLRPERATGYDLRLGWTSPDGRVGLAATGYRLRVRDQIAYVAGRYRNLARTRSAGLELEADATLTDNLRLKLAYAVLDAVDATSGRSLIRVPDRSGAASLLWAAEKWSGAATLRAESSQTDTARDGFSPVRRQGFATADLTAAYAISEEVSLTARLENLAAARYQETFGYSEPGRALYLGVRLKN
jgi:vitamin B12 transporter